ncbi:MAG: TIGR04282 family arsenosugar biosynthesis glycosyltransferase [Leptospiraceae bacterium]|nr:TIGR04282 family arsenosugar biosynthesis glycosyltransferase [Leptospiraceae bacterium]
MNAVLIIFARLPVFGQVKTRLERDLGPERTLQYYRRLVAQLAQTVHRLRQNTAIPVAVFYAGDTTQAKDTASDREALADLQGILQADHWTRQINGTLGERMCHAFTTVAERHPGKSITLCGTDIPQLNDTDLLAAFQALTLAPAVLLPVHDGGYGLIGLSATALSEPDGLPAIFALQRWSHPGVLPEQIEHLESAGYAPVLLKPVADIDTFDDALRYHAHRPELLQGLFGDIRVVIPVWNEAENLRDLIQTLQQLPWLREVIIADNDSSDNSRVLARTLGARVTRCRERGYGATCLAALADIRKRGGCDIVLFMDGDGADAPQSYWSVIAPVLQGRYNFCLGYRDPQTAERGALQAHQRFGNWLATTLIRLVYRYRFLDLGPLRAIQWDALESLCMDDRNYGWTIQMQIRAILAGLSMLELAVPYRRRQYGQGKVTSSLRASLRAGMVILGSVWQERRWQPDTDCD